MSEVYLLTGGNMGDRPFYLAKAKEAIEKKCGPLLQESSIYETEAWGLTDQSKFLNQALAVHTSLLPEEVLAAALQIEEELGRKRLVRYGPRIIDIDILLFDDQIVHLPGLTIPHPQLQNRRFALQCLADIAAQKMHPVLQKTISQLLADCTDPLTVNKFS